MHDERLTKRRRDAEDIGNGFLGASAPPVKVLQ